jgi:hypothetical protein
LWFCAQGAQNNGVQPSSKLAPSAALGGTRLGSESDCPTIFKKKARQRLILIEKFDIIL